MKLISLADFVLEQRENLLRASENREKAFSSTYLDRIFNYATLLKKPLSIEMFVPCDYEGNPLSKPERFLDGDCEEQNNSVTWIREQAYKKALSKVLFEGFNLNHKNSIITIVSCSDLEYKHQSIGFGFKNGSHSDIESIVCRGVTLTEAGKAQIFP